MVSSLRVLVTGGAGFIGSHLVDRLMASGDEVFVVDDLSTGSLEYLKRYLDGGLRFFNVDIRHLDHYSFIFKDLDAVVHLASLIRSLAPLGRRL